ncbi:MAG: phenylalanine--tRNA ligase subunit beta [Paraprevotella sp.]|nr:phenylalanine--tRNA ligase subunit beta [Paraprevotella sp.]
MNISYNWLKEYVDFDLTAQEVADALTSEGLEVGGVEEVQPVKGGLQGLVIGEVLTCIPHPNSDHMHICTVNLGNGESPVQIVCGASNVAAGQKVVVATLGCKLYDGDDCFTIKKSKLRGVESNGMICAEDEIGIGTDHAGIIVLPETAVPGTPAAEYYHLESDYLIEVDITPNRADACSHYGVARDLYAWLIQHGYKTALHRPSVDAFTVDNHDLDIDIEVRNTEACPRYAAVTIKNCEVKESPEWLQDKLRIIGLRPINNVVDITNYIMFAYGQPLHCFDADMIKGGKVVVKTMPEGTPFVTLDGEEHKLSDRDLAICNAEEPMCIAGVFGGKGSGTYDTTRNVLLESAYFNSTWIRKSARRHGLSTDASFRFERGVDPNGTIYALKQAALLCKELTGGEVAMDIKDVYPNPLPDFIVDLNYDYAYRLMGKNIGAETVKSIVTSLEMKILDETSEGLKLQVPAYRVDVQRPCDVVEDVLRVYGYNNVEIPLSVKSTLNVKGEEDKSHKLQNLVAEQLVGCGFNEILNNSLQRSAYYDGLESYPAARLVKLMNPLSSDLNAMRQTLLFGGLECVAHNANHKNADLKFFEFGNCYYYHEENKCADIIPGVSSSRDPEVIKHVLDAYSEDYHLGLWVTGKRVKGSWAHPDEDSSFYELKAYVLNILSRLGVNFGTLVFAPSHNDIYSKGIEIQNRGGKVLAMLGIVSRKIQKALDVDNEVYYADLNWKLLMKNIRNNTVSYTEISRYPAVSRDLALLLDKHVEFSEIEKVAYSTEKKLLKEVALFDVYEGKNLEIGKKSYAVNFVLQDETKTLNDKQIDTIMSKLIANLQDKLGAKLR